MFSNKDKKHDKTSNHKRGKFYCPCCLKKFRDRDELAIHLQYCKGKDKDASNR